MKSGRLGPYYDCSNEVVTPRDIIVYNSLRCDKLIGVAQLTSNNYTGVHAGIAYRQAVKVHIRKKGAKST